MLSTVGRVDDEASAILEKVFITEPIDDKRRIENTKGGLIEDCYQWILEARDFQNWYGEDREEGNLLSIRSDPGKGKTMLLCGIIDFIKNYLQETGLPWSLAIFFCQATDTRLNTKESVLRGLARMLMKQNRACDEDIVNKYGHSGPDVFTGPNGWTAAKFIMDALCKGVNSRPAYIIVDTVDECTYGVHELVAFLSSFASKTVRILVSSRNWNAIKNALEQRPGNICISLEMNEDKLKRAISLYVNQRVKELARCKALDSRLEKTVRDDISRRSSSTFLWASLVCQELFSPKTTRYTILVQLQDFSRGIEVFYTGEIARIRRESADWNKTAWMVSVICSAFRPLTLPELSTLDVFPDLDELNEKWRVFLTLRQNTVYVVHQSSWDSLSRYFRKTGTDEGDRLLFSHIHQRIANLSLVAMSRVLGQDMFGCQDAAIHIDKALTKDNHVLDPINYACFHWMAHACIPTHQDAKSGHFLNSGPIYMFFTQHTLHGLEACSLLRVTWIAILGLNNLVNVACSLNMTNYAQMGDVIYPGMQVDTEPSLIELLQDVRRLLRYFSECIISYPIQIYTCAPVFTPASGPLRRLLGLDRMKPPWMASLPEPRKTWDDCLQVIPCEKCLAFSKERNEIGGLSRHHQVVIWRAENGGMLHSVDPGYPIAQMAFSPAADIVALGSGSSDGEAKVISLWQTCTNTVQKIAEFDKTLPGFSSLSFTADGSRLIATTNSTQTMPLQVTSWSVPPQLIGSLAAWRDAGGQRTTWSGPPQCNAEGISPCGSFIVVQGPAETPSCQGDLRYIPHSRMVLRVYDLYTGKSLGLEIACDGSPSVAFSDDSNRVVLRGSDKLVIYEMHTGNTWELPIFFNQQDLDLVSGMAWSPLGDRIAVAIPGKGIYSSNLEGRDTQLLTGSNNLSDSIFYSWDGHRIISASPICGIQIWNAEPRGQMSDLDHGSSSRLRFVSMCLEDQAAIFWSSTGFQVRSARTGEIVYMLGKGVLCSRYSQLQGQKRLIVTREAEDDLEVWDISTGHLRSRIPVSANGRSMMNTEVRGPVEISDDKNIAAFIWKGRLELWDISNEESSMIDLPVWLAQKTWVSVAIGPENRIVGITPDLEVEVWRHTGKKWEMNSLYSDMELRTMAGRTSSNATEVSIAFSPIGGRVAAGFFANEKGAVATQEIWDSGSGAFVTSAAHTLPMVTEWFFEIGDDIKCDWEVALREVERSETHTWWGEQLFGAELFSAPQESGTKLRIPGEDSPFKDWIHVGEQPKLWVPSGWWVRCGEVWSTAIPLHDDSGRILPIVLSDVYAQDKE